MEEIEESKRLTFFFPNFYWTCKIARGEATFEDVVSHSLNVIKIQIMYVLF